MKDYCHGFCSFDFSKGVTEYANGSKVVIEAFKELFALSAEEPKITQPEEPKIIVPEIAVPRLEQALP